MQEQFILVFVKDGVAIPVFGEAAASLCQFQKTKLKGLPEYKGGLFQVRRKKAFEKVKVLINWEKTKNGWRIKK